MTKLLERAFKEAFKLPEVDQNALAKCVYPKLRILPLNFLKILKKDFPKVPSECLAITRRV